MRRQSKAEGPSAPYPRPAPPRELRRSSRNRKAPVPDDDARYFINAYEKSTLTTHQKNSQASDEEVKEGKEEIDDIEEEGNIAEEEGEKESSRNERTYHAEIGEEPRTFLEAANRPDADLWEAAMLEELKIFEKIGLYE